MSKLVVVPFPFPPLKKSGKIYHYFLSREKKIPIIKLSTLALVD